jgi:trehalose-phosphatase
VTPFDRLLDRTLRCPAEELSVLLDFDGTLAPIVPKPEDARPSDDLLSTVRRLASICPVAVISGRGLRDLGTRVRVPGIVLAGAHGAEIRFPDGTEIHPVNREGIRPIVDRVKRVMTGEIPERSGLHLEDKGLSLALHFREARESTANRVCRTFREIVERMVPEGTLELFPGKKVLDLKPATVDKGTAVTRILERLERKRSCALYLGDDETDEDAFAALEGRGITVLVSQTPRSGTKAEYRLGSPEEVRRFLRALCIELDEKKD